MVINIRGTGGSGKSTLVREVMTRCLSVQKVYEAGRRQPIGYLCRRRGIEAPLCIPGHYEIPTGGCDTIRTPDRVYRIVSEHARAGCDVLFEGIIVQDETKRFIELSRSYEARVIALDVPLEVCLAAIAGRRVDKHQAKGQGILFGDVGGPKEVNPRRTTERAQRLPGIIRNLQAAGVDARWGTREQALAWCVEWLKL